MSQLVSIIIPNYKTRFMTELCLRSLKRYTDMSRVEVIVVDNDSRDDSVEYLRGLDWIKLIERKTDGETGPVMHSKALDLALEGVKSKYTLVMHTDTIVTCSGWLDFLIDKIEENERIAAVGSWKLERVSWLKRLCKKGEDLLRRILNRRKALDREHYFRSHCAFYRTDLLKACKSTFATGPSAGIAVFNELREKGYELPFIASEELSRYILHLNHATLVLNPTPGARKTNSKLARMKLLREISELEARLEK